MKKGENRGNGSKSIKLFKILKKMAWFVNA